MNEPTLYTLTQRLDRLEREVRWWKAFGSVTIVVLGLGLLLGAAQAKIPNELQARAFVLVDEAGKRRASLDLFGEPGLTIFDRSGLSRIRLGLLGNGLPALELYDPPAWPRAVLGHMPFGLLQEVPTGTRLERPVSSLVFLGKDGKVIWKAP